MIKFQSEEYRKGFQLIWSQKNNIRTWLPKLQAHRGYCLKGAAPNTLDSIKSAQSMGYLMAEFDVRLTADGVIVLFHDSHFNEKLISETNYQELNLKIKVSKFVEVLQWLEKTEHFKLNIEIKSNEIFNYSLEKKVCELILRYKTEDSVIISSFNPFTLFKVRLFASGLRRALLLTFENNRDNNFLIRSLVLNILCRPHVLNLRFDDYSRRFRELAKKIPVVLWTVNDLSFYQKIANEIHGIISDTIVPTDLKVVTHAEIH